MWWWTHPADQFKALLMPILFYKHKGRFLLEQGTFSWRTNKRVHLVYQRYDYEYSCMPVYPFLAAMLIPIQQVWLHIWLWLKINCPLLYFGSLWCCHCFYVNSMLASHLIYYFFKIRTEIPMWECVWKWF